MFESFYFYIYILHFFQKILGVHPFCWRMSGFWKAFPPKLKDATLLRGAPHIRVAAHDGASRERLCDDGAAAHVAICHAMDEMNELNNVIDMNGHI